MGQLRIHCRNDFREEINQADTNVQFCDIRMTTVPRSPGTLFRA